MARTALGIGELGNITTRKIKHRSYESRARVGTIDGTTRQVRARAATAEQSRARLGSKARQVAYLGAGAPITSDTTITELVTACLDDMERTATVLPQSLRTYRSVLVTLSGKHGDPALGKARLGDTTPALVSGWVEQVGQRAPSAGRRAKVVLSKSFDYATRKGLDLWRTNPADAAHLVTVEPDAAVEISDMELSGIRHAIRTWQTDRKMTPLRLIVEMLIATGARLNELLALRWSDLDLSTTPATVTISGTLVVDEHGKIVRQDHPKTEKGYRTLSLPEWAADLLRAWRGMATDLRVFPSRAGTWLSAANVRRAFREALDGTPYEGWMFKDFRSGVATRIERVLGVEEAARQLGHESPAITSRHYVKRAHVAGDYTAVLDQFAPDQSVA